VAGLLRDAESSLRGPMLEQRMQELEALIRALEGEREGA
jgi:hypothetical protein